MTGGLTGNVRPGNVTGQTSRRTGWLLTVPLALAGAEIAHSLAYRVVAHDHDHEEELLASSGHGYLTHLPLAAGLGLALVLLALAARIADAAAGNRRSRALAAWPFALLPPLAFTIQEHLERLLHSGSFPFEAALEPTFVVGVVLQLPAACLAYCVCRALLAAADVVGRLVGDPRLPRVRIISTPAPSIPQLSLPPALATGHAERGPPCIR